MIGYAVGINPELASFRLRVAVPAPHMGFPYCIGGVGEVTFFYKQGDPKRAKRCGPVVFDVVNDHFTTQPSTVEMCDIAHTVTVASQAMAARVLQATGRDAVVIEDPWETNEEPPACDGDAVGWFGHVANFGSLSRYGLEDKGLKLLVCTNYPAQGVLHWNRQNELQTIRRSAVVLLTGNNPGASSNRVVKALRAGRFVVAPKDCPDAWKALRDYIWIGDICEGVRWALNNREEACKKVEAGQQAIRKKYSPQSIGSQWGALFASILAVATREKRAGSVSILR